jgi:hypothetical protein
MPFWAFASGVADNMLYHADMRRDVQEIFKMTPHDKQVMMFSATLSKEIRPVCKKFMQDVMSCSLLQPSFQLLPYLNTACSLMFFLVAMLNCRYESSSCLLSLRSVLHVVYSELWSSFPFSFSIPIYHIRWKGKVEGSFT